MTYRELATMAINLLNTLFGTPINTNNIEVSGTAILDESEDSNG